MTGDGVNDALALKDADIGVAMGSGAAATRAVAQLVLLDGKFATLPGVVAEGRRVIANIERSANLFVTKTVYAILLAIAVVIAGWPYPFLPRHLTIISTFTIGIPGFFLALAPNSRRYIPGFIVRVLRFTIPAGIVAAAAALVIAYGIARYGHDLADARGAHDRGAGADRGRRCGCSCSRPGRSTGGRPCSWRRWSARSIADPGRARAPRLLRGAAPAGRRARGGGDRRGRRDRAARGGVAVQPRDRQPPQLRRGRRRPTPPTRRSWLEPPLPLEPAGRARTVASTIKPSASG